MAAVYEGWLELITKRRSAPRHNDKPFAVGLNHSQAVIDKIPEEVLGHTVRIDITRGKPARVVVPVSRPPVTGRLDWSFSERCSVLSRSLLSRLP